MGIEDLTKLEHQCRLQFDVPNKSRRMTNIICTVGRSTRTVEILKQMIHEGCCIFRLNFSHDPHDFHAGSIKRIREAVELYSREVGYHVQVGIAIDTRGPEIRTGFIESGGNNEVELKRNDSIRLSINKDLLDKGTKECVYVDYPDIINVVQMGTRIFVNDGIIVLIVKEIAVDCLICQIEVGGMLGSRKGVSIPGVAINLPSVSEKDRFDLKFAIENRVDFVFASGVRTSAAIKDIRAELGERGKDIKIVAKLSTNQSLQYLDEIISFADGVLIARSDLGVEIPSEKMFLLRKAVTARCNKVGKPVICANQILESMRYQPKPTRAEVNDLASCVLDGVDCVMLASESAIGRYPVETVIALATICREAELALWNRNLFQDLLARNPASIDAAHAIAISAVDSAKKSMAKAIVVLTTSGKSAYLVSRYRPVCPILAVTRCARAARQVLLYRGIVPVLCTDDPDPDWHADVNNRLQYGLLIGKKLNIVQTGDTVIIVSAWKDGPGFTNNMRIVYAFYEEDSIDCILKPKDVADANAANEQNKKRLS